jgi:hypothetical protein
MAGIAQLHCMIGLRNGVPGGLSYIDETDVQFISGRNIIRYDMDTRSQRIQSGSLESCGITAITMTNNRR